MSVIYEYNGRVDSREIDAQNQARPSAVLGYLQEAATSAAMALHVSRDEVVAKYNCFWMLARIWYELERPLHFDEQVTVHTWHRGGHGASMYRDFDVFVNGEQVGQAVSVWVLADLDTHRLLRFSRVDECREETTGGARCKDIQISNLKLPGDLTLAEQRRMHYSDTDINGHVNNAHYADFACDALHLETLGQGRFVSSLQLCYHAECLPGEDILLYTGTQEGTCYVSGRDGLEKPRFSAALTLGTL